MATTAAAVTSTAVAAVTPGHRQHDQPPEQHEAEDDRRDPHVFTRPKRRSRPLVLGDGLEELLPAEVGPQHVGEHELRIGQLPQQEVRDAVLARRADDEVGIGLVGVVQVRPDGPLVDLAGGHALGHQGPHGVHDLGPPAVVERHGERHAPVALGQGDGLVHAPQHPARHPPVPAPGEADPDALVVQLVAPAHEERLVEPHEVPDLVGGTAPVLGREGEHREPPDPEVEGPVDGVEERLLPRRVALGAGQAPLAGPAAVAVHDTRHVGGDVRGVDALRHWSVGRQHHAPNLLLGSRLRTPTGPGPRPPGGAPPAHGPGRDDAGQPMAAPRRLRRL